MGYGGVFMEEDLNYKSIYETIYDFAHKNHGDIYENQDFKIGGKFDVEQFLMGEELLIERKYSLSRKLIENVENYLDHSDYEKLVDFLDENNLILYYFTFCEMISAYINDGFIDRLALRSIAEKFVTKSNEESLIKLGITLLGVTDKEKAKAYGRVLGLLSEYTFFVVYAVKGSIGENGFVFDLFKSTYGYGRLICLQNIYPFNDEMKDKILTLGMDNEGLEGVSSSILSKKVNLSWYLDPSIVNEKYFHGISKVIVNILKLEEKSIYTLEDSPKVLMFYLNQIEEMGNTIDDMMAIDYLGYALYREAEDVDMIPKSLKEKMVDKIGEVIVSKKWKPIFRKALKEGLYDLDFYYNIGDIIDETIEFDDLEAFMKKNPLDIAVYYHIGDSGDKKDMMKLLKFAKANLPFDEISCGSEDLKEENLTPENDGDICLMFLLKFLMEYDIEDDELYISSLSARFNECRKLSLRYLKKRNIVKNRDIQELLKALAHTEPNIEIRQKITKLICSDKDKGIEKKEETINVKNQLVTPHIKDISLMTTNVAGMYYRNMDVIEGTIEENDIVLLKREKNNPYDKNAILVTTEKGYVIGYVPRHDNYILKQLLDSGKYLYGIIEDLDLDKNYMKIDVVLSYKDVILDIKEIMSMINGSNNLKN